MYRSIVSEVAAGNTPCMSPPLSLVLADLTALTSQLPLEDPRCGDQSSATPRFPRPRIQREVPLITLDLSNYFLMLLQLVLVPLAALECMSLLTYAIVREDPVALPWGTMPFSLEICPP